MLDHSAKRTALRTFCKVKCSVNILLARQLGAGHPVELTVARTLARFAVERSLNSHFKILLIPSKVVTQRIYFLCFVDKSDQKKIQDECFSRTQPCTESS